ncbi:MAG: TRAP transporter small permease [Burkholderiales bacterium]|jgi:C4-dicarboxylate transporter DctQ subunit|nr:TRAP transporter small permease [Burkholderiales bacterium]
MLKFFNKILNRLEETIVAVLMASATVIIFSAVVHRHLISVQIESSYWQWLVPMLTPLQDWLFELNFAWAQELCVFMFVWMAKFGAAYGVRTGIHVGIDVVVNLLKPHVRRWLVLFSMCAGAFFTGCIGTMGTGYVYGLATRPTPTTSDVLEIPIWIVYMAIPLGSYLMCFRFLQVAWAYLRTGELPHHDASHVEGLEEETKEAKALEDGIKNTAPGKTGDKEEDRS